MRAFHELPSVVWASAAFAAGIALAEQVRPQAGTATLALAAAGAAWALCWIAGLPAVRWLGALACFAALGLVHSTWHEIQQPSWTRQLDGSRVVARAVVRAPPEPARGGWRATARLVAVGPAAATSGGRRPSEWRGSAAPRSNEAAGPALQPAGGTVRFTGQGRPPDWAPGTEVLVRGRFRAGRPAGNPGERSEQDALRRNGLVGVLRADPGEGIDVLRPGRPSIRGAVAAARRRVAAAALRGLPEPYGGLLLSLLIGVEAYLPAHVYQQFWRAGLLHLMVVSGAQVGIVAGAFAWAARLARLPVLVASVAGGLAVATFAAMVGWAPSIGRAVIMATAGLAAAALGRQRDRASALAAAALVLLAARPAYLFDVGFQLSFAATWGLLFLAPALQRQLSWMGPTLSGALSVTLGAQIAVAPLLASHFQIVAVAGLAANVLALPIIAALVPAGFALMPVVVAFPPAAGPLLPLLLPALKAIMWTGAWFGGVPWASVTSPPVPAWMVAVCFAGLGALIGLGTGTWRPPRAHRIVLAAAAVLAAALWYAGATRPPAGLAVTVLDVGQGDAILIRSPSGLAALIDGGGEVGAGRDGWDVGRMRVVPALRRAGVRRLDLLVLTHPHEDHAGGLPAVVENFPVGLVLDPGIPHPSPSYIRLLRMVEAGRIPYRTARAGMTVDLEAGVRLDVLYPPEPIPRLEGDPVHAGSVVARLTYGQTAMLLTGDAEGPAEQHLIDQGTTLLAQVLKVGHHGSRTSTTRAFVERVRPQAAVISAGADNVFGHPHPDTLRTLAAAGARVLRTDQDGAVGLTSNGAAWQVITARVPAGAWVR